MFPRELKELLDVYAEDDETSLFILSAEMPADELSFIFNLSIPDINDLGPVDQIWRVTTRGYKTSRISFDHADQFEILEDHPLLWDYSDVQTELFFKGEIKEASKLLIDLFIVHQRLYKGYKPFPLVVEENLNFFKPFQYSNGSLVKGSKKTLLEYGNVLKQNGVDFYLLGERDPTYWTGFEFLPESKDLKLMLMQRSYLIADDYTFEQLS